MMDMSFRYVQPVEIVFGAGACGKLADWLAGRGLCRALLLCDDFLIGAGAAARVREAAGGRVAAVRGGIRPNPTLQNVDDVVASLRAVSADALIAMGGGSVLDAGKIAAALCCETFAAADCHAGRAGLSGKRLPVVAIPTTAGTGSEVTMVSVLSDEQSGVKAPVGHPALFPSLALVDPELTYSLPPAVTASTGMDALSHALEAYWSVHHQPICDALAVRAAALCFANLLPAFENGGDLAARAGMSEASLLAGLAFALPKTAGVHACSYPLTASFGLPHGVACALTLDAFVRINKDAEAGRVQALARELGFADADALAGRIRAMKQAMGLPCSLREAGIADEAAPGLARASLHPNLANNPVALSEADLAAMYRALA